MKDVRKLLVEETKNQMKQNNLTDYKMLVDYFIKNDIHIFQFNRLNEKDQEQITTLVNKIIHNNDELFKNYKDYQETLKSLYELKTERNYSYQIKDMDIPLDDWYQNQKDDIDVRIANGILKELKSEIPQPHDQETKNITNETEFEEEFLDEAVLSTVRESVNEALTTSLQKNISSSYDSNAPNINFEAVKNDAVRSEHAKSKINFNLLLKKMNNSLKQMNEKNHLQYKNLVKDFEKKLKEGEEEIEDDFRFDY